MKIYYRTWSAPVASRCAQEHSLGAKEDICGTSLTKNVFTRGKEAWRNRTNSAEENTLLVGTIALG
jgi:hypothetical protein